MQRSRALAPRRARLLLARRVTARVALAGVLAAPSCTDVDRSVGVRPGPVALSLSQDDALLTTYAVGAPATYTNSVSASASSAGLTTTGLKAMLSVSVSAPTSDPRTVVRIYKDHDAWRSVGDGGRDEATLESMGKVEGTNYFVHPMDALGAGIPAGTRVVIITANSAGNTETSAAQRREEAQQKLLEFLQTGGTLLVDLADNEPDNGYNVPGSKDTPSHKLPSHCRDATLAQAALGADGAARTADDHRFVRGPDGLAGSADDLDDVRIDLAIGGSTEQEDNSQGGEVKEACAVVHGNLQDGMTLPSSARVLATAKFAEGLLIEERPVLAEYCHAGGRVIVNTFTLGYYGHKPREGLTEPIRMSFIQKSLYTYALSAETYCNKAPTIMSPANLEVGTDAGACVATILNVGDPDVVDDADGVSVVGSRSDDQPLSAAYPKGLTSITWTATDAGGESASATQTVLVNDVEKPVLAAPANITVNTDPGLPSARVDVGAASATDNCSDVPVVITAVRSDGALALDAPYGAGTTTITWTARDGSGNEASALQMIVVNDAEAPVVIVPASFIVNATMPSGAKVTYTSSATDNVGVTSWSCSRASGTVFPIGRNVVTCTALDGAGNSTSREFTVMVLGAPEQIVKLIEYVRGAMINSTHRALLLDYLTRVLADPRSTPYACGTLDFFIGAVRARSGTAIPVAKANRMITDATRIKAVLACP